MARKYEPKTPKYEARWLEMLEKAVNEPGEMMAAYRAFHNYSLRNQMVAAFQCLERGLQIGPIKTGKAWNEANRKIKTGESGIYLCFPKPGKRTDKVTGDEISYMYFDWAKWWFVYDQTEGEEYDDTAVKAVWDKELAYKTLNIEEIPYESFNGNSQGYAQFPNKLAINPVAQLPYKTRFHELAHIVLGHVHDKNTLMVDFDELTKDIIEVEAEATAMLCLDALELEGAEYCRGYIQNWMANGQNTKITDQMAHRIINAADKILRAGTKKDS